MVGVRWLWCGVLLLFAVGLGIGYYWPLPPDDESAALEGAQTSPVTGSERTPLAELRAIVPPAPLFVDVTQASSIDFRHENGMQGKYEYLEMMGGGVGLLDYDGDGDLDLYVVNGNRLHDPPDPAITNKLYRNEGNLKFIDVTQAAGVGDTGYGQGCAAADYDSDGDIDLYVTNYGPNVLYRNNGDGTFSDVTEEARVADDGWGQSVCFFDYDGDGKLDLLVQNYLAKGVTEGIEAFVNVGTKRVQDYPSPLNFEGSANRLYRNLGDGTFADVTESSGLVRKDGKGMGLACVDFDDKYGDDIFVANDTMENFFYRNEGGGKFSEVGHEVGVAYNGAGIPEASMGVDAADYDEDGDWDLIVPCLARQFFTLYRNDGEQFTDVAAMSGLARATAGATGFDAHFFDADNDGDLDLFFTNGGVRMKEGVAADADYETRYGMQDLLLANDGQGRFGDVSAQAGEYFRRALIGRGSAVGDLDRDGDLDLVIANLAGPLVVLRNDSPRQHWIALEFTTRSGEKQPNGVSVWLTAGDRRQHRTTAPGTSYLSQSDRRLHFGLGGAREVSKVEIRWPDGSTQSLESLSADRVLVIHQDGG
jgi:hypothetical protein